jgi:hypothetical protein
VKAIPVCLAVLALLAAGSAGAQLYKWVDQDGKVRYGDTPPPGAKTSAIKAPEPVPAPGAKALTPAEEEQAFRRRQAEARKQEEKAEADSRAKTERSENCERMRNQLLALQSGQRMARINASGERYYADENQIAQEAAELQRSMQQACN